MNYISHYKHVQAHRDTLNLFISPSQTDEMYDRVLQCLNISKHNTVKFNDNFNFNWKCFKTLRDLFPSDPVLISVIVDGGVIMYCKNNFEICFYLDHQQPVIHIPKWTWDLRESINTKTYFNIGLNLNAYDEFIRYAIHYYNSPLPFLERLKYTLHYPNVNPEVMIMEYNVMNANELVGLSIPNFHWQLKLIYKRYLLKCGALSSTLSAAFWDTFKQSLECQQGIIDLKCASWMSVYFPWDLWKMIQDFVA